MNSMEKYRKAISLEPFNDRTEIPVYPIMITSLSKFGGITQAEAFNSVDAWLGAAEATFEKVGRPDVMAVAYPADTVFNMFLPSRAPGRELDDEAQYQFIETPYFDDPERPALHGVARVVVEGAVDGGAGEVDRLAEQVVAALEPGARAVLAPGDLHVRGAIRVVAVHLKDVPVEKGERCQVHDEHDDGRDCQKTADLLKVRLAVHDTAPPQTPVFEIYDSRAYDKAFRNRGKPENRAAPIARGNHWTPAA